ncbi:MAG: hypothetical protein N3E52_01470 [Candidatus Bathyarchaeota archaeon]|nr:hypothetical protein [Candidatus Bathyarchaeota archaeon]
MEAPKKSRVKRFVGLAAFVIVLLPVAYSALTYPRGLVDFSVSFTIGADSRHLEFEVPFLHEHVRVEVSVRSGNSLWSAKILSGNDVLWNHTTTQREQTTYSSEWIKLPSGRYNFTFATAGMGSLEAEIKLTSKGGFW